VSASEAAYGNRPDWVGRFPIDLGEVMYYLYLPVKMPDDPQYRLPPNVSRCWGIIHAAIAHAAPKTYSYVYLSARMGWATPDNPLNRPGWHCDGFGTDDLNYVWWKGPGTRFAIQKFSNISIDHVASLAQFESQIDPESVVADLPECNLYALTPFVVHATPTISAGCMRQYIKVSLSNHVYNMEHNSHNYLFDYTWPMEERKKVRNDTHRAQRDYP
jgi:hypothetical protein